MENHFEEETFISYDATNKRVYTYDRVRIGGRRRDTFETLALYEQVSNYNVNIVGRGVVSFPDVHRLKEVRLAYCVY